jgi:hypothetical protein
MRRADVLVIAALAALTLVYFAKILFLDQALYFGDTLLSMYPTAAFWRDAVARGDLPLWNPYILAGMPFLADAELSALYPTMVLNLILPLHRALAADLAFHVFLFGAGTYVFLRRQGMDWLAALVGGVVISFSGFFAVRVTQPNLLRTAAWLPLLLIVVQRVAHEGIGWRLMLAFATLLAVQIFAGHLQTVLITGLLVLAFGGWVAGKRSPGRRRRFVHLGLLFAGAGLFAALLAAVQILPGIELVGQSDRAGGAGFDFATSYSLPPRQMLMLLAPDVFGNPTTAIYWGDWLYWEMTGYAGVVPLLLGAMGLLFSPRRDGIFWGLAALAGVGMALGHFSPLYVLAYKLLPAIGYFRVPARFLLWYAWAVAILAAYGMEWLRSAPATSRSWRITAGLLVAGCAATLYWALAGPGIAPALEGLAARAMRSAPYLPAAFYADVVDLAAEVGVGEGRRLALLWGAATFLLILARAGRASPRVVSGALLALILGDLFSYGMNFYPTTTPRAISESPALERALELDRGAYRVLTTPNFTYTTWVRTMTRTVITDPEELAAFRSSLIPNMSAQRRITNVWGYAPIALKNPIQAIHMGVQRAAKHEGRSRLLDFLGARYIFTRAYLAQTYRLIHRDGFHVWRNDRALPRGILLTRFVVEPRDGVVREMLAREWDTARVAILDRRPVETFGLRAGDTPGEILGREYDLTRVAFRLALTRPAILVLSDAAYPGWKVFVDGVEQPLYRANLAFRAVMLPGGAERVEFVYRPLSVLLGGLISLGAWLCLAAVGVGAAWQRRARLGAARPAGRRAARPARVAETGS